MKNRDFQFSRTRKQLQQYKSQGKKTVIWKLSYKQIEVLKMMRIKFEPYLYKIKTRTFYNIRSVKSSLLKEIHYKSYQGKNFFLTLFRSKKDNP